MNTMKKMLEKRIYEEPELVWVDLDLEDIITTSGETDDSGDSWIGEWDTEF